MRSVLALLHMLSVLLSVPMRSMLSIGLPTVSVSQAQRRGGRRGGKRGKIKVSSAGTHARDLGEKKRQTVLHGHMRNLCRSA